MYVHNRFQRTAAKTDLHYLYHPYKALSIEYFMVGNFKGTAKKAKIQVSESFAVLVFAVGKSGTRRLATVWLKVE